MTGRPGHLQCPFCNSYEVDRLYLAGVNLDSCECGACCARWEEDARTGEYRGRSGPSSVLIQHRSRRR